MIPETKIVLIRIYLQVVLLHTASCIFCALDKIPNFALETANATTCIFLSQRLLPSPTPLLYIFSLSVHNPFKWNSHWGVDKKYTFCSVMPFFSRKPSFTFSNLIG